MFRHDTRQPGTRVVVVSVIVAALIGLPGAGKSTVARHVCSVLMLEPIDRDCIRAAMFPDCAFTREEKRAANRAVYAAVEANCRLGRSSLIDGMTLSRQGERDALADLCGRHGARFVPVWLDCPAPLARARIAADAAAHPAGDRDAALVDRVAAAFEAPGHDVHRVPADLPRAELCTRVTAILREALAIS